jgi:molecular chaperone GrpE
MTEEKNTVGENLDPNSASTGDAEPMGPEIEITDEELLALCKARVCAVCTEKGEADEVRLRALAEMDNFKKRLTREQEETRKYAAETVLADMLPILDNLELALDHGRKLDACKDVVLGVDMTRKLFLDALKQHGLVAVGEVGEMFDPTRYEAVGHEEHPEMEEGVVCSLLQRGYILRERLLRPARVVVNKAGG